MICFQAQYHSGTTSASQWVEVQVDDSGLIRIPELGLQFEHWAELDVSPRIGNTPRYIGLPDSLGQLETLQNDTVDQLQSNLESKGFNGLIHSLEHSWRMILLSSVAALVVIWGSVIYGVPALAKYAASHVPDEVIFSLGDEALNIFDAEMFLPSKLSAERQQQIQALFKNAVPPNKDYTLLFRASPKIGANALALPNNVVIMTDELVNLASDDKEIEVVLAHEVGHLEHDHSIRGLLQKAGLAAVVIVISGDVASVTANVALIPVLLLELGYSRRFEFEADDYAHQYMKENQIDEQHFVSILSKLNSSHHKHAQQHADDSSVADRNHSHNESNLEVEDKQSNVLNYLSTHPAIEDRIKRINSRSH